jgi:hypothetical protein
MTQVVVSSKSPAPVATRRAIHSVRWGVTSLALVVFWAGCAPGSSEAPTRAPEHKVQLAAFLGEADMRFPARGESGIQAFEDLIGKRLASVMWYVTWDDVFPENDVSLVHGRGAIPHLTWELFWPSRDPNNTREVAPGQSGLDDVLRGRYDDYIDRFASAGAKADGPVFIRFLHEFNGNWYVWSGNKNGRERGGPAKVRAVWRYVVNRCRSQGADNFIWVWCPHGPSIDVSTESWNALSTYWPGEDTVDWFGIDAYNWYPSDPWGGTRPYRDPSVFLEPAYTQCQALAQLPVMIAETGSPEFSYESVNKAQWIERLFAETARRPMVRMLVWFHIDKEHDWRVDSSAASLEAFRRGAAQPWMTDQPKAKPKVR